jgi:PhnB protein
MKISVHVMFKGDCESAFAAYARILGGAVVYSLTWSDSPASAQAPADWQGKIYHATMKLGDLTLMGADPLPADYRPLQGVSLAVAPANPAEAHRVFAELAEGGVERMPIQETFWSPAFGVVTDRFGLEWEINCDPEPERA